MAGLASGTGNLRAPLSERKDDLAATGVFRMPSGQFLAYIDVDRKRLRLDTFVSFAETKHAREVAHVKFSRA